MFLFQTFSCILLNTLRTFQFLLTYLHYIYTFLAVVDSSVVTSLTSETIPNENESEKDGLVTSVSVDESSLMVISKKPQNATEELMLGAVKASVKACFGEWRSMTVSSFVENIFQQNIKLQDTHGNNPLNVRKKSVNDNNPSESRKAVKFIVSFCENEEELLKLLSLKNVSSVTLERMKAGRELGNKLEGRVRAWCNENVNVKNKQLKLGALGKSVIKNKTEVFHFKVAHREPWNGVKKMMMDKFKEDNEKSNESEK